MSGDPDKCDTESPRKKIEAVATLARILELFTTSSIGYGREDSSLRKSELTTRFQTTTVFLQKI